MLVEFSLKPVYSTMVGEKIQNYGVYIPRKCIESIHFYSCASPFPVPSQNSSSSSIRKYKDDLEH